MTSPSPTDLMKLFLASSEGEKQKYWVKALESIKLKPVKEDLAGGSNQQQTKSKEMRMQTEKGLK